MTTRKKLPLNLSYSSSNARPDCLNTTKPKTIQSFVGKLSPKGKQRVKRSKKNSSFHSRGASYTPEINDKSKGLASRKFKSIHRRFLTSISPENAGKSFVKKCFIPKYHTFDSTEINKGQKAKDVRYFKDFSKKIYNNLSPYLVIRTEIANKKYKNALSLLEKLDKNTTTPESLYWRGLCYFKTKDYLKALFDFELAINTGLPISAGLFITLYKCNNQLKKPLEAKNYIDLCLKYFPSNTEARLIRGKINEKNKNYEDALQDLEKVQNWKSFLLQSKCWKYLKNYTNAIKYLEKVNEQGKFQDKFSMEMGKLKYKFFSLEEALDNFNRVLKSDNCNQEALYYIAKTKILLGDIEEAELLLEKIAQICKSEDMLSRLICKLSYLKLCKNDFYGAFTTLKRVTWELKSENKKNHAKHAEAAYNVIQGNYKQSISLFKDLISQEASVEKLHSCLIYKAFSHFFLKDFISAVDDYEKAEKISDLDSASNYNYKLSLAMVDYTSKNYYATLGHLKPENFKNSSNSMWKILRVHCLLLVSNQNGFDATEALQEVKLIKNNKKDSEIYLLLALCNFFETNFEVSMIQVEKCIKNSDKNSFLAFTLKAFCHVALKNYADAYECFASAMAVNKELKTLYPFRGLCAFFAGNSVEAVKDLKKISNIKDENAPLLSIYLLVVCHCPDEALELAETFKYTPEIEIIKAHCYIIKQEYNKAISCLENIHDANTENDLFIIRNFMEGRPLTKGVGLIFSEKFDIWIEGLQKFYNKEYDTASDLFELIFTHISGQKELIFLDNPILEQERLEILYNLTLCCMFIRTKKGLQRMCEILNGIFDIYDTLNSADMFLLGVIAEKAVGNTLKAEKFLKKVAELNPMLYESFMNNKDIFLAPLCTDSDFSKKFPVITVPEFPNIKLRPAIRIPALQPPLDFNDCFDILLNMLRLEGVVVRPEVPWLPKVENNYVFTDILVDDVESHKSECNLHRIVERMCKSYQILRQNSSFSLE
ncbi:hypothetical protein SteCoe_18122 [Stentor coeruleus]|uniref:Uncharacterized protein n=1 Tax=Stentor coeruleus TaxID=5963 RepID=A0A1R2BXB9_9CILI|nr:hypothetical protein SteCoe_18122 [Stentor coeruleus]